MLRPSNPCRGSWCACRRSWVVGRAAPQRSHGRRGLAPEPVAEDGGSTDARKHPDLESLERALLRPDAPPSPELDMEASGAARPGGRMLLHAFFDYEKRLESDLPTILTTLAFVMATITYERGACRAAVCYLAATARPGHPPGARAALPTTPPLLTPAPLCFRAPSRRCPEPP